MAAYVTRLTRVVVTTLTAASPTPLTAAPTILLMFGIVKDISKLW